MDMVIATISSGGLQGCFPTPVPSPARIPFVVAREISNPGLSKLDSHLSQMPPSSSPTEMPSASPTASPTASPKGALRIEIVPDLFGQEISFSLKRTSPQGDSTEIDRLDMGTIEARSQTDPIRRYIYIYQDLPLNAVFDLQVKDFGNDGICCSHGEGSIAVYEIDNHSGMEKSQILFSDGQYSSQMKQQFFFPSMME